MGETFHIYSLEAGLAPSNTVSWPVYTFEFATIVRAEIPGKNGGGSFRFLQLSASSPFPPLSIRCATGLPSLPWASQIYPSGLAHPHWPLDNILDSDLSLTPLPPSRLFCTSSHSFLVLFCCIVLFWPGNYLAIWETNQWEWTGLPSQKTLLKWIPDLKDMSCLHPKELTYLVVSYPSNF